jgi:hypothetical protein
MATHKPIGHQSKKHSGTIEEAHSRPETLHGFKMTQKKSAVPEKKHKADGESNPSLSKTAGDLDY